MKLDLSIMKKIYDQGNCTGITKNCEDYCYKLSGSGDGCYVYITKNGGTEKDFAKFIIDKYRYKKLRLLNES
ncbi:MAG: hypothetical protein ABSG25_07115 [Bryobacteraceae bacterium]